MKPDFQVILKVAWVAVGEKSTLWRESGKWMVKLSQHASRTKVQLFLISGFSLKMIVSMRAELYLKKCHVFQLRSFPGVVTGNERCTNYLATGLRWRTI